ncbi:hypothetical protein DI14_14380 [Exiguobacterium sp. AB2]|nr:hypothetical protein DI14_14380 [Exiguobacterium sp. AB2]
MNQFNVMVFNHLGRIEAEREANRIFMVLVSGRLFDDATHTFRDILDRGVHQFPFTHHSLQSSLTSASFRPLKRTNRVILTTDFLPIPNFP